MFKTAETLNSEGFTRQASLSRLVLQTSVMTSVMRLFMILLVWYVLLGYITSEVYSDDYYNFRHNFNGCFTNKKQVQNDTEGHEFIEGYFVPCQIPTLAPRNQLVVKEIANKGKIVRFVVYDVSEQSPGKILMVPYKLTNQDFYKNPDAPVTAVDFSNLTTADIQLIEGCTVTIESIGNCEYIGVWDNCQNRVNGTPNHYVLTMRSNDLFVEYPTLAPEKYSHEHMHYFRRGLRYTVPEDPDNQKFTCK